MIVQHNTIYVHATKATVEFRPGDNDEHCILICKTKGEVQEQVYVFLTGKQIIDIWTGLGEFRAAKEKK